MSINIKALQAAVDRKNEINNELEVMKKDLSDIDYEIKRQLAIVQKEKRDVEKLENGSIENIFMNLVSNYEKRFDKEMNEYEEAEAVYDSLLNERAVVVHNMDKLKKEYDSINVDFDDLLQAKKERLRELAKDPAVSEQLNEFTQEIKDIDKNIIEVNEAYSVGQQAITRLNDIQRQLNSAEGWGIYDLVGGGIFSSMVKHEKMNQARMEIDRLKLLINSYESELNDVDYIGNIDIEIDDFIKFTDIFFDNVFSDFSSLNTIQKAKQQINAAYDRVYEIQKNLYDFKLELAERKNALSRAINNLIIDSE